MSVQSPAPEAFQTSGRVWLRDFEFGLTGLTVRKTGARVPYSPKVIGEVTAWFRFFFSWRAAEPIGPRFTIYFTPERARPWYLIRAVSHLAGAVLAKDISQADVVMQFEDATYSPNGAPQNTKPGAKLINFACWDISKSRVAAASEAAFGASLAIDPTAFVGEAVEKSQINAAHDGRIVKCPQPAAPGRVYQRVIDNRTPDLSMVEDLRTCTLGGKPIVVFVKRRPVAKRFQNTNVDVQLRRPDEVFSEDELARITAFCTDIGLEWGGVDVLRDRKDGSLQIVDANKTDMGPPIDLNLPDKIVAAGILARAFRDFIKS